ncbi:Zinc fingerC2H2 [Penicillium desertorum]|jgi:hypothetical protein|uniref:Zinc fingerC2H2 n=1 Tax=Penicillium desertorum TaxID=1303715 RepID=A0A9W9WJF5_9EURO|nr:Zinc fingerC2H2 [Penicillium desertorum]
MEPRFFGESETGDWMSLGVDPDLRFAPANSTMDNHLAFEMGQDTALLDSIFRSPESLENQYEFSSFDEHISSYTTDVEPISDRDFFEPDEPL